MVMAIFLIEVPNTVMVPPVEAVVVAVLPTFSVKMVSSTDALQMFATFSLT